MQLVAGTSATVTTTGQTATVSYTPAMGVTAAFFIAGTAGVTGTTSTTGAMMGLGSMFSATTSAATSGWMNGRITGLQIFQGTKPTAGNTVRWGMYYGTGTPPPHGSPIVGTLLTAMQLDWVTNAQFLDEPFNFSQLAPVSPSMTYWFDIGATAGVSTGINQCNFSQLQFQAFEI